MPDTIRGQAQFGADHYRPQKHFPHLAAEYSNLFYCCNPCNSRKKSHWPAPSRAAKDFIPNPCDHVMFQHLRYKQGEVEAKSDAGKFTLDLLDLNDPQEVEYRDNVINMIEVYEDRKQEFEKTVSELKRLRVQGEIPAAQADLDIAELESEIQKAENVLKQLTGRD